MMNRKKEAGVCLVCLVEAAAGMRSVSPRQWQSNRRKLGYTGLYQEDSWKIHQETERMSPAMTQKTGYPTMRL
jgi:hypothetical protein